MDCCSEFQLGSIDRLAPAVKRLSDRYHPHLPLAVESTDATVIHAGMHSFEQTGDACRQTHAHNLLDGHVGSAARSRCPFDAQLRVSKHCNKALYSSNSCQ